MNLFFWQSDNFGDLLSPYIYIKLKNDKFTFVDVYNNSNYDKKHMLMIGSILRYANSSSVVCGVGFKDDIEINKIKFSKDTDIRIVRGYLTKQLLENKFGYTLNSVVVGDPGLLLKKIYNPDVKKKYKIGVIPHYNHTDIVNNLITKSKYVNIINIRCSKKNIHEYDVSQIEDKIKEILECETVFSSSLHGLITAHAYGIPAVWCRCKDKNEPKFKFLDYYTSLGITDVEPVELCGKNLNTDYPQPSFPVNTDKLFSAVVSVLSDT